MKSMLSTCKKMGLSGLILAGLMNTVSAQTLVFASEDDWYPFTAAIDGKAQGLSVDLISEAYALNGIAVEFRPSPYIRCMDLALHAEVAGCFNTARNADLQTKYLYSQEPIFQAAIYIYATADSKVSGLNVKALEGYAVGVALGYEYGSEFDFNTKIIKDIATSELLSFTKLQRKRIPYVVAYDASVQSIVNNNPGLQGAFKVVGKVTDSKLYVSFSKNYPGIKPVMQAFDDGIRKLHASGRYQAILNKWKIE